MSQERATVDEYHDLLAEVERLHAIIGDQQILLGEHAMDNRHAYEEGGNSEREAVVAWIRGHGMAHYAKINLDYAATMIERGEHRRKEKE